jgi:integrase
VSAQEARALLGVLIDPSFAESRAELTLVRLRAALGRWERIAGVVTLADVTLERARTFLVTRLVDCQPSSVAADFNSLTAVLSAEEAGGRFDTALLRDLRRLGRQHLWQHQPGRVIAPVAPPEPVPVVDPGVPRALADVLRDPSFRSRSEVTLHNYRCALRRWQRCAGVATTADVTLEAARRFVDARLATVAPASCATEYHAVMSILDAEERAGRFDAEQLHRLRRLVPELPRKKSLCAPFLTHEQVETAIAAAPHARAVLAIRLLSLTGLRASELTRLEWADVDLARRVLHVRRGKTGARKVSLCAPAVKVLEAALALKGDRAAAGQVVVGAARRNAQHWLELTSKRVGFKVTACLLRHTRASWWVAAGVPIAVVAKQLGHSIFVASKYYVGLDDAYNALVERGATGT